MSGIDGLVRARQQQLSDLLQRSQVRRMAGTGQSTREQSFWEGSLATLGAAEDVLTRAIGNVVSSDPKYDFGGTTNYHTQVSFADLFRTAGVGHSIAAILGIAAALVNPLDPLNKLAVLKETKLGVAARGIKTAGKNLVKDTDGLLRISTAKIAEEIAQNRKLLEAGVFADDIVPSVHRSIARLEDTQKNAGELNDLLVELQRRGVDLEKLELAGSVFEQIKQGQRHLIGFTSPMSLSHVPFSGAHAVDQASVFGLSGPKTAALVKGITGVKNVVVKPLTDAAYKVADYIGIPTIRTEAAKKAAALIKGTFGKSNQRVEELERDLLSIYRRFIYEGSYNSADAAKQDLLSVLQKMEFDNTAHKQLSIDALSRAPQPEDIVAGVDVALGKGGLSAEQKLQLTPSGVSDVELPTAINLFETAHQPSTRIGVHKQHEVRVVGRYVVVKTADQKVAQATLDDLSEVFGNRAWTKHTNAQGTYIVQKRQPGASRISNTDDFTVEHLKNMEVIAAQLSKTKKGFTSLKAEDIIVSPSGAVQIVNPSVIVEYKSAKDAVANSRAALDSLAENLAVPRGAAREFPSLANVKTAREVPSGVDGMAFRVARPTLGMSDKVLYVPAYDVLEQAVNTDGHKALVRLAEDTPGVRLPADKRADVDAIGDVADFEQSNNVAYYREQIRKAREQGVSPEIEPISVVVDDANNMFVANGRDRLTAAILEGYEAVPVYRRNFIGEVKDIEGGFYTGKTVRLRNAWNPSEEAAAIHIAPSRASLSTNYSLLNRDGEAVKLEAQDVVLSDKLPLLLNRLVTMGPHFVGQTRRSQRIASVLQALTTTFGSVDNAFLQLASAAEKASSFKEFVVTLEKALVNPKTKQGITLSDALRHPDAETLFAQFKNASTETLDALASRGVFTETTIQNKRRALLATDKADNVLLHVDTGANTLRVYGAQTTTEHLQQVAESFLTKNATVADLDPYMRLELYGADSLKKLEARDLISGIPHPRLADIMEPVKVFQISKEQKELLKRRGILVEEGRNAGEIKEALKQQGLEFGTLLKEVTESATARNATTGKFVGATTQQTRIVRPEFAFFVTRSGALAIGTKHQNVADLLSTVFEEGPAFFEEFGVMTTGKVVVSNPFGSKLAKINVGELGQLTERLKLLAKRFNDIGLGHGTVMEVHVPFDDAVWRAMFGERVTIGDILKDKFKLRIPDQLVGHVPDIRVIAPSKLPIANAGVVALERTRLANKRMQALFDHLQNAGDKLFLEQARAGVPISYYSSWFGRHLTDKAKEALNDAWLKYPNKESKSFKYVESALKGRVFTDLTTQEINTIIKRLKKEGYEGAEDVIADVVKQFRNGYELKPSKETGASLVALANVIPEGIAFFHTDPIWATALSGRAASRAISRKEVVDGLRDMQVAVWHGSVEDLNKLRVGASREYAAIENKIAEAQNRLSETQKQLEQVSAGTPDIHSNQLKAKHQADIDAIVNELATLQGSKTKFIQKSMTGKVMDHMVDPMSDQIWVRGNDVQRLVDEGLIKHQDIVGDVSDAFVRVPVKKYEAMLEQGNAEVFLFPKEVEGAVRRFFGAHTKEGFDRFLGLWDSVHSLWRNWTLFPIPSYHVRNGISNMFMAYLGGVTDPGVYREAFNVFNILDSHRKGSMSTAQVVDALGAIKIASADGQVFTGKQIYDAFVQHGGLAGGIHYNEFNAFGDVTRASEFEKEAVKAGLRPSSELAGSLLYDNALIRGGVSVASYVENRCRFAAFLDSVQKGHTEVRNGVAITGYEAAALRMKSIYYDYGDLSAFERSWLRRVIPFYSWSRHNIPRMIETLVTDPVKHYRMNQFIHELETGVNDGQPINEQEIPVWMREKYGIVVDKTKGGNYIVKTMDGFLPMADAYKILSGGGITQMLRDGITPFVKIPVEQLVNYSFYSGQAIEDVPGQRSSSYTLGQVGFSRRATTEGPLSVLNLILNDSVFRGFFRPGGELVTKVLDPIFDSKEGPSIKLALYALFIGKAYEVNPQQARAALFRDWGKRHNQIMGVRNQAARIGDTKSVEDADRMLTWLRLQYPGNTDD